MEVIHAHFKDRMTYDGKSKTAISVRDGFLEYAGAEIGKEPSDKIFKVYRSPATIANVANLMKDIPLTDEHVDLDKPVENAKGRVTNAIMIDLNDESTHSKLAIKNVVDVEDDAKGILDSGKRELSLGYKGVLVEYTGDEYDFEQKNISPHHLAIVDQGRCGSMCSFIDKKTKEVEMTKRQKEFLDRISKMYGTDKPKADDKFETNFVDSAGAPNMQEIVDMTIALPDAIKSMPIDELKKLAPKLQAIIANAGVGETPVEDEDGEEGETPETPAEDTPEGEPKVEVKDEEGEEVAVKDTAEFKDALAKAVETQLVEHTDVIMKARDFVDEKYDFKGKDTKQIMRDALAVNHGSQKFADSELPVAFKLLKQNKSYSDFADGDSKSKLNDLKNKEI